MAYRSLDPVPFENRPPLSRQAPERVKLVDGLRYKEWDFYCQTLVSSLSCSPSPPRALAFRALAYCLYLSNPLLHSLPFASLAHAVPQLRAWPTGVMWNRD